MFRIAVLFITLLFPMSSLADTHTAASCSYSDVSDAVTAASSGDTVSIPACAETTWTSVLAITKGITLKGAGQGVTNIKGAVSGDYLIKYTPATPANDEALTVTDATWNMDGAASRWLWLENTGQTAQTKIRIYNNTVIGGTSLPVMLIEGPMFGVIHSNTLYGFHVDNYGQHTCDDWSGSAPSFSMGSANNLYFEDNTFHLSNTAATGGHGGRYVYRYNTFVYVSGTISPWFDMHGNQTSGNILGPRGGEIYGNTIDTDPKAFDHRGGQMMIFYNQTTGNSSTAYAREEYDDSTACSGLYTMRVNNSYYWNNRDSNSIISFTCGEEEQCDDSCGYTIAADSNFWQQGGSFDGTSGVGCGTLASRPATCTTGVGYWATNQSCSDLSGMVGASPSTPISGTLYKCTSTDTWTAYYTPYTYPHPLRGLQGTMSLGGSGTITFGVGGGTIILGN